MPTTKNKKPLQRQVRLVAFPAQGSRRPKLTCPRWVYIRAMALAGAEPLPAMSRDRSTAVALALEDLAGVTLHKVPCPRIVARVARFLKKVTGAVVVEGI